MTRPTPRRPRPVPPARPGPPGAPAAPGPRPHDAPRGARGAQRPAAGDVRGDGVEHHRDQRAAADRGRPRGQPDRLHLGRRRHPADDDGHHPDLGQAGRPVQQEAAGAGGAGHLLRRLAGRGVRAEHGGADRRPGLPGPRRRRPHRAGAGRHRQHGQPARARSLQRLHRRGLRPRHRQRPPHRWPHRRQPAGLAGLLLRPAPHRGRRVRRTPEAVEAAGRQAQGLRRLRRRDPHRRRRLDPARLGLPGRRELRLDLADQRPPGRRRRAGHRRRGVRRGAGRRRARHPAAPLPRPHHRAGHRRLRHDRHRDVRLDGLPQPVLPALPRHVPHRGRSDVDRHGRRPAGLQHRHRTDHHRDRLWKRYLVGGSALVAIGFSLLATIDHTTDLVVVGGYMALLGLGIGATMQNLVLAVQNNTRQADMGAASADRRVLPLHGRRRRRLGARRRAGPPGPRLPGGRPREARRLGRRHRRRLDPRRVVAAGAGAQPLRDRLRRGHRPHLPDLGAVRARRLRLHPLHPGGAAAHHPRRRGVRRIGHPVPAAPERA